MLNAGASRDRLAAILGAAFADGLLSEQTLSHRLGLLFGHRLVDPHGLVGDLSVRGRHPTARGAPLPALAAASWARLIAWLAAPDAGSGETDSLVLALDWAGGQEDLVVGRGPQCDIGLDDETVSRRHARLVLRDGIWTIEDLGSLNGTAVNGTIVGRAALRPGDRVLLGRQALEID
jgi:FHA domain